VLSMGGMIEFGFSALLDCIENARHRFIFHVVTELLIASAVAAMLSGTSAFSDQRSAVSQNPERAHRPLDHGKSTN
jgi:hypothetical protein